MRLSAKERIGLRAMIEFARRHGQGPTPLSEISRIENLPLPYLEHVVGELRRAGLLQSARGTHGGYLLSKKTSSISVGDVFRAVEGALVPMECLGADSAACAREPVCAARNVWQTISERLSETLDHTSLSDLLVGETERWKG
jgi:Rrf2 family protein